MKYRVQDIELPEGNIYAHDALNRKPVVEFIEKFLTGLDGPFVLALDSPWGTGKTTTVRMLKSSLAANNVPCIYFNAWKVDYASDPLVALVSALDDMKTRDAGVPSQFKSCMAKVRKLTTSIAKHGAVAAVKAATLGTLDIDPAVEKVAADLAGDLTKDVVASFQKERASLDSLRTALEDAIAALSKDADSKPLVFFIDELDRCRPSFAIEMLERVKHLFDVNHLVFVLSIDRSEVGRNFRIPT